jgi:hypothetical protein
MTDIQKLRHIYDEELARHLSNSAPYPIVAIIEKMKADSPRGKDSTQGVAESVGKRTG